MVERLVAALGGVDEHAEVLARRLLTDEFVQALGTKGEIGVLGGTFGSRDPGRVGCHRQLIRRSMAERQARRGNRA